LGFGEKPQGKEGGFAGPRVGTRFEAWAFGLKRVGWAVFGLLVEWRLSAVSNSGEGLHLEVGYAPVARSGEWKDHLEAK
jgi:hypothetical protein